MLRKCRASCNNGVNVILRKLGKRGGGGGRTSLRQLEFYFDASLFLCFSFFASFSLCLLFVCSFSFSVVFKRTKLVWLEYNITLYGYLCLHFVWSTYVYCTIISAPIERHFKCHCSRPTSLSYDDKQCQCYNEMFHG